MPVLIVAPAGHGTSDHHPTGVTSLILIAGIYSEQPTLGADGGESTIRRCGLAGIIVAPAIRRSIVSTHRCGDARR